MGHPYAPAGLELPGFVLLQLSQCEILVSYIGTSVLVVLVVWFFFARCGRLSKTDRLLMCWWAFTVLTHILIEGPFVFTPNFFKKENPNFFDEVWKEYSKGDSWYVARDAATVMVEGITAVLEGPASLLAVQEVYLCRTISVWTIKQNLCWTYCFILFPSLQARRVCLQDNFSVYWNAELHPCWTSR